MRDLRKRVSFFVGILKSEKREAQAPLLAKPGFPGSVNIRFLKNPDGDRYGDFYIWKMFPRTAPPRSSSLGLSSP